MSATAAHFFNPANVAGASNHCETRRQRPRRDKIFGSENYELVGAGPFALVKLVTKSAISNRNSSIEGISISKAT
jgi:hypothetical protein